MGAQMKLPGLVPQWTLGDRLRKAREIAGLNQSEMSEQIGIARNSVANYESGKYEPPRPVLIAWAFRTGIALDWLAKGDPPDDGPTPVRSTTQPGNLADEWATIRPGDARERTEDEDNPVEAALLAAEGPVPDLAARLNGPGGSRPLLSASPPTTAELADVRSALRKRIPLRPPVREPGMRAAVAM